MTSRTQTTEHMLQGTGLPKNLGARTLGVPQGAMGECYLRQAILFVAQRYCQ